MLCKVCHSFYVRPPCPECERQTESALKNLGKPESDEPKTVHSQKVKTKSRASGSRHAKSKAKSPAKTSKKPLTQKGFLIPSEELPSSTVKEKIKARTVFSKSPSLKKSSQAHSKPQNKFVKQHFTHEQTDMSGIEYQKKVKTTLTEVMSLLEELVKS